MGLKQQRFHGNIRSAWKEYHRSRLPPAFQIQVKNFMKAVFAEGRAGNEDDEDNRNKKMGVVTCPLTTDEIDKVLAKAAEKCQKEVDKYTDSQEVEVEFVQSSIR